jgi:outer membrane protein TolC
LFFLLATPQLDRDERAALIAELATSGVPTVSGVGPTDLELGALATFRTDALQELARRVALNLHHVIRGGSTTDLPVLLAGESRLVIEGRVAAARGFPLGYEVRLLADIRHPEALEAAALPLDLMQLVAIADTSNVSLALSRQRVETSQETRQAALGPLLPQVGLDAAWNYYDLPRENAVLPDQVANLGLRVSQMIYDDASVSSYRQAGRQLEASRYLERAQQLDVYLGAEQAYYDLLNASIYFDIQRDNLRVTEGNRDIARTRADVGQAGQDEVYRWEAEVAKQRTTVLDAAALVETFHLALNQVLGTDLATRWQLAEMEPRDLPFGEFVAQADPDLSSPTEYESFEAAAVVVALADAPELLALDHYLGAQDIAVGRRQRTFFVPQVYVDAFFYDNFHQDPDVPDVSGSGIEARLVASLPLFEGTRRINELQREKSVRRELVHERALTAQLVEQRTRTALRRIRSAVPSVAFSSQAAENSRLNFEVVREKYVNGIVGITDLLEAQNTRLRDELGAVSARYALLRQVAVLERSLAFSAAAATPEEIAGLADRIRAAMTN